VIAGDWGQFLCGAEENELNALRMATRTGHPAGDSGFITTLSRFTGRQLQMKTPGRPRKKD